MRTALVLSLLVAVVAPAHADDFVGYEVEGDAPAAASDPRLAALDDGFAHAVLAALTDLVPVDVRAARKADLDREIVGHARLWVAKFTVTRDETNDDRRQLALAVKIDRDKLRARLSELGIATQDAATPANPAVAADADSLRVATILLRVTTPAGTRASFGDGALKDLPGLPTLTAALRGAGFALARAPAHGTSPETTANAPLPDDSALALGAEAKAQLVAVSTIDVGASVPVRGQPETAALVMAHVRMLDGRARDLVGQGTAVTAAVGEGDVATGKAIERSLAEALTDALPAPSQAIARAAQYVAEDTPVAEPGVVLVRLPAKTPWAMVVSEQKYLAGARGVQATSLRRLSPAGWTLGVTTNESIERIAEIAKKPPATDTQSTVRIVGNVVEVTLSGPP